MLYQGDHAFRLAADADVRPVFTMDGELAGAVAVHQHGGVFRGARQP